MPRMILAADELRRVACASFAGFDGQIAVEQLASRRWASITFSGERHEIRLRLDGAGAASAADAFLENLRDREFDLRGHILADIALVRDEREGDCRVRLSLEALTVEAS